MAIAGAAFLSALAAAPALATTSEITSGFNGTNIADTSSIWFNSHLTNVSGGTTPFSIFFTDQTISLTSPQTGISYTFDVPDAQVTFDPSLSPVTTFDQGIWQTYVPSDSGTPFLSGFTWDLPDGENPKAATVTWSGNFLSTDPGVSLDWQWSAAVYKEFSTDYNALGVTAVDGMGGHSQSGTPANFDDFVTGGARGGGGSNFTGSNSGTGHADFVGVIPEPSSGILLLASGAFMVLRFRRRFR